MRKLTDIRAAFTAASAFTPSHLMAGGLVARGVAGGQRQVRGRQMWRVISAVSSKAGGARCHPKSSILKTNSENVTNSVFDQHLPALPSCLLSVAMGRLLRRRSFLRCGSWPEVGGIAKGGMMAFTNASARHPLCYFKTGVVLNFCCSYSASG